MTHESIYRQVFRFGQGVLASGTTPSSASGKVPNCLRSVVTSMNRFIVYVTGSACTDIAILPPQRLSFRENKNILITFMIKKDCDAVNRIGPLAKESIIMREL